jgi:hypothetical protein
MSDLPWWDPVCFALAAIVDVLPREQQQTIVARWRAMADVPGGQGRPDGGLLSPPARR